MKDNFILMRIFTKGDYVADFRSGNVRLMSCKFYKDFEETDVSKSLYYSNRHDMFDNSLGVFNHDEKGQATIDITGVEYNKVTFNTNSGTFGPMIISNIAVDQMTKIYCLYTIFKSKIIDNKLSTVIDSMEGDLGEYYCLITKPLEFIRRVDLAISKVVDNSILEYDRRFVQYFDEDNYSGKTGPFLKPLGLRWQNEYRLKLVTELDEPYYLNIGSIKDISIWGKIADFNNGFIKGNEMQIPNFRQ